MWRTVERPGYFGEKRNELIEGFDRRYGKNKWKIAWQFGNQIIEKPEARQLYEDGYYEHFKRVPSWVDWLVNNFSDVYDTDESNVNSRFDYNIQETDSTHLQDIAIRRSLLRLGKEFRGERLLEVRGKRSEGWNLSPCRVPFHLPDMISREPTLYQGEKRDFGFNQPWWVKYGVPDNVEHFYQQNKLLQVTE